MSIDFDIYNQDLLARGRKRFLFQFNNSPNLDQLLQSLTVSKQELYDATLAVMNDRLLENATGTVLDVLGDLVGQYRTLLTTTDAIYKDYISSKIFKNQTQSASIPELQYFVKYLTDQDVSFYSPYGKLDLWIIVNEDIPLDILAMLVSVDNNDKLVGVKYFLPLAATTRLVGILFKSDTIFFTPDLEAGKVDVASAGIVVSL